MDKPDLVIFFDGQCPLCCNEMRALKTADHQARISTNTAYPAVEVAVRG